MQATQRQSILDRWGPPSNLIVLLTRFEPFRLVLVLGGPHRGLVPDVEERRGEGGDGATERRHRRRPRPRRRVVRLGSDVRAQAHHALATEQKKEETETLTQYSSGHPSNVVQFPL